MRNPNEVNYRHIRFMDDFGNISNMGGVTVAYVQTDENTITFATAVCSIKDNFCKRTGRKIARQRLTAPKYAGVMNCTWEEFHSKEKWQEFDEYVCEVIYGGM